MQNSKLIEVVEKKLSNYQRKKNYFTKTQKGELPKETEEMLEFFSQITRILKTLEGVEMPKEKEEFETCTLCGGLGKRPNHPHIEARRCEKCKGVGKISRNDYKMWNAALEECRLYITKLTLRAEKAEQALGDMRGKAGVISIRRILKQSKWLPEKELAQAISKMITEGG